MSCSPNTIYYQPISVPLTSGCKSCGCNNSVDSDLVIYSGPNLSCTGIATCNTITEAIQKLDAKVCEAQEGVQAINGVNRSGNFIKLGGSLTEPTVITTSGANTLSILNLQDDNTPQYIMSLSNGILRRTTYQTILGFLTADNGLNKNSATNVRLGGNLVVPTAIGTNATNTLSITGLVTDPAPVFVLTQTTPGVVTKTALSSIIPPTPATITADNGLTKTGSNIQLGGTLIVPTTIATSLTNTLSITGLNTQIVLPNFIITQTNAGVTERIAPSVITNAAAALITADNGLNKSSNTIKLGGPLLTDTTVTTGTNKLVFRENGSSGTGIEIDASVTVANNRTNYYGRGFFQGNVGINTVPDYPGSPSTTDIPLKVEKGGQFRTADSQVTARDIILSMVTPGTGTSGTRIYAAGVDRMYWNISANQLLSPLSIFSGHLAYFQFLSPNTTSGTPQSANCSASAAQGYFTGNGTLDRIIAYRAMNPISETQVGLTFTGNLTEAVGVQIENQKSDSLMAPLIGSSYGIKQLGASDRNYFNGTFQIPSTNLSMGVATLSSGVAVVSTSAVKTGSRIFLTYNTISGKLGFLSAPAASIIDGVSFVINSTDDVGLSVLDDSTVNWWVINN